MGELWWRTKHYVAWVMGVIGTGLSLLAGFKLIDYFFADQNFKGLLATWYLLGLIGFLMLGGGVRIWQTIRKERYANVTAFLHQIHHQIRDFETYLDLRQPAAGATANEHEHYVTLATGMLRTVLDRLASMFVSLTSTYCRTSIKLTYEHEGALYFYTLARDTGSEQKNRELDRKRTADNHDPLTRNSEFARLFRADLEQWHFVCNDLCRQHGFSTTSMTAYKPGYGETVERQGVLAQMRNQRWPLPYKSTIACAIRQGRFEHADRLDPIVIGFLTVDSESRNVFVERWDVQIVFAVADALYHPLRKLISAQNAAETAGVNLA